MKKSEPGTGYLMYFIIAGFVFVFLLADLVSTYRSGFSGGNYWMILAGLTIVAANLYLGFEKWKDSAGQLKRRGSKAKRK